MRARRQRRKGRWARSGWICAVACIWLTTFTACSAEVDLAGGRTVTSRHRWSSVESVDIVGARWKWTSVVLEPDIGITHVQGIHGYGHDFGRNVWVMAAGLRAPDLWRNVFFSFQVGVAAPQTPALSSTQQFVSTLGWSIGRLSFMLRHISNASTRGPNLGETMLLVGVKLPVHM